MSRGTPRICMKMFYAYLSVLVPGVAVLLPLLEREIAKQVSFVDAGATVSDKPIRQTREGEPVGGAQGTAGKIEQREVEEKDMHCGKGKKVRVGRSKRRRKRM